MGQVENRPTRRAQMIEPFPGPGLVKICGLREPAHAQAAVAAGADLLGFIFAPARRRVTPEVARACISSARAVANDRRVLAVGVFVGASIDEMNSVAATAGLDLIQLHGAEPPSLLRCLRRPVLKAVRPPAGTTADRVDETIGAYCDSENAPVAFLLDGHSPDAAGGEGIRADWQLAAMVAQRWPLVLAGGLDPTNVAGAIAVAAPIAVDVSSGVETQGVKDPSKIAAFVAAAKDAFGRVGEGAG